MFKRLAIESALATLLVLSAMWIFSLIPLSLSALQPIEKAIKDIDIIDIYYSQVNGDQTEVGKSVVLVNIGDADRFEIGWLVNAIGESGPSAIGVDVFFASAFVKNARMALEAFVVFSRSLIPVLWLRPSKAAGVSCPFNRSIKSAMSMLNFSFLLMMMD